MPGFAWHHVGMKTQTESAKDTRQTPPLLGSDYLSQETLARELNVSERTIARWHVLRIGPPRCTVGKTILYRRESVLQWLASREDAPGKATRQKAGKF